MEVVGAAGASGPVLGAAEVVADHPDPGGPVVLFKLRIGEEPLGDLWERRGR
jgi:hypothetical protein